MIEDAFEEQERTEAATDDLEHGTVSSNRPKTALTKQKTP